MLGLRPPRPAGTAAPKMPTKPLTPEGRAMVSGRSTKTANLLGLDDPSPVASSVLRRSRTSEVPQIVGQISASKFITPKTSNANADPFGLGDLDFSLEAPRAPVKPLHLPKPPTEPAPAKNRVVRPSAPTESLLAAEPVSSTVVAVPQTRTRIEPLPSFDSKKLRGGKRGASEAPSGSASHLLTQPLVRSIREDGDKPANVSPLKPRAGAFVPLQGAPEKWTQFTGYDDKLVSSRGPTPQPGPGVFGVGTPGAKPMDGVSRVPAPSFKQRFVAKAQSWGSSIRNAGRSLKQRLTPAQEGRVDAISNRMSAINEQTMKLRLSGRTDAAALKQEMDALQKEGELLEGERLRIVNAGRLKRGVRNTALGIRNVASRVGNVFKRKPKTAAVTTESTEEKPGAEVFQMTESPLVRKNAEAAVTKIQALARGNAARKEAQMLRAAKAEAVAASSAAARLASETVPAATPAVNEAVSWRQVQTKEEKPGPVFTPGLVTARGNQPQEAVTSTVQLNTQRASPPLPKAPRPEQQQEPVVGMESPTGVAADLGMTKPVVARKATVNVDAARKIQALARKVIKVNNAIKPGPEMSADEARVEIRRRNALKRAAKAEASSQIPPSGLAGNRAERVKKMLGGPTQEELQATMANARRQEAISTNKRQRENKKKRQKQKEKKADAQNAAIPAEASPEAVDTSYKMYEMD